MSLWDSKSFENLCSMLRIWEFEWFTGVLVLQRYKELSDRFQKRVEICSGLGPLSILIRHCQYFVCPSFKKRRVLKMKSATSSCGFLTAV